jgi:excisionase family DNA binding protein
MLGGSNKLLSMPETAEFLGVPVSSLQHYWRSWGLTGYKVGKRVQFRERDLEQWLTQHRAA